MSRYLLAAILATAVVVIFEPRPWVNPTLSEAGLFLLAAGWAAAFIVRPFAVRVDFPMIPLACAAAWGLLQLVAGWTVSPADTRIAVLTWAANLAAFSLALQMRRRIVDLLLYIAFVLSVAAVVQYFSGATKIFWLFPNDETPALGPFVNRDQFAAFVELVLPVALVEAVGGGRRAWQFAVISAALYASVIAGASRAGAILATVEIGAVYFASPRVPKGRVWFGLLAAVFVAVVGWTVLWNRFRDPHPLEDRREILADTISMVRARPLTGFGLGAFRTVYPAYAFRDFGAVVQHAHDDWAEWLADGGIPFGVLMVSIVVWSVPKAIRSVWGVGVLAVFVHSLVDFPLQKPALELWLFTLLGTLPS